MANLPLCRVTSGNLPFHFTEIDFVGPILVMQWRSQLNKRYACVFTCLAIRAMYLEHAFDTDTFINALRRFINRKGKPHAFSLILGGRWHRLNGLWSFRCFLAKETWLINYVN